MGTILASALIDKAGLALTDTTNTRWTRAELLKWLNQGQRQIVQIEPGANNVVENLSLAAGTRQTLPSTSFQLLDVIRNTGADGLTPGRAVRVVSQDLLDNFDPDWHAATPAAVVQNYTYNPNDPDHFFVYPPADGTTKVLINYAKIPGDIAESDPITIPDAYEAALLDYILYRAASKDAEYAQGLAAAQMYLQSFISALGASDGALGRSNPNNDLSGGTPTSRGTS